MEIFLGKVDSENRFGLPKIPRKKKSRLFVISRRKVGQGATDEMRAMNWRSLSYYGHKQLLGLLASYAYSLGVFERGF